MKKPFSVIIHLLLFIAALFLVPLAAPKADIYGEGVEIFREYLRIDTSNPPGNEMKTALFLKKILDREGIENRIFDLGGGRANLYAVIRGDGSRRALVLSHHMDVVPADPAFWDHPPFSGALAGGEVWGRGAVDMKGKGIIDLVTMLRIKRMKAPLKRDLVLLAVADEEADSGGTRWILKNRPDLIKDAEFLIDEGTGVRQDGKEMDYLFSFCDKAPLWLTITFRGEPGHGSEPQGNSAVDRAIRAAYRILEMEKDFHVLPQVVEEVEEHLRGRSLDRIPGYGGDLRSSLKNREFLREIARDPEINSLITNTVSITRLKGSGSVNIIPNEASIGLDCRLLPGTDKDGFINRLKAAMGEEEAQIQVDEYMEPLMSPVDNDFTRALKACAAKRDPDALVLPVINASSTDSSLFRSLGIAAYGFEPYCLTDGEANRTHGNNERMPVKSFRFGMDLMLDLVLELNR